MPKSFRVSVLDMERDPNSRPIVKRVWGKFSMGQINNGSCFSTDVYLLTENRLFREALVRMFRKRAGIRVVGQSSQSESSVEKVAAAEPDVLLLDSLRTALATNLINRFAEEAPQIKIVLFGMDEDAEIFLEAVRLGVSGYVLKDASAAEVISAVRGVAQGEAVCPPKLCLNLFELVSREFREKPGTTDQRQSTSFDLTQRQRQLVALVERGLTNKEIATNLNLSEFTVKNHIYRIMKLVDAENRYEAVDVIRAGGCSAPR
jgi:two-component system, NarL family, nitrate/nitrite response regulator NarL